MLNIQEASNLISQLTKAVETAQKSTGDMTTESLVEKAKKFRKFNSLDWDEWEGEFEFTEKQENFVICYIQHNWGRGKSIQEACDNCPNWNSKKETVLIAITVPAGTPYKPADNPNGIADKVYVDGMGSIHYPANAGYYMMNRGDETIKIRMVKS